MCCTAGQLTQTKAITAIVSSNDAPQRQYQNSEDRLRNVTKIYADQDTDGPARTPANPSANRSPRPPSKTTAPLNDIFAAVTAGAGFEQARSHDDPDQMRLLRRAAPTVDGQAMQPLQDALLRVALPDAALDRRRP